MTEVMLARTATELPGDGWAYEPKWDGWRGVLTARRLLSRNGKDLSRRFPSLLGLVPAGTTLDGEIVCFLDGRLSFSGLARGGRAGIAYVAFDVLRHEGGDVRRDTFRNRRALLETIALPPPLVLVESTNDRAQADIWWDSYQAAGLEGIVAKRLTDPYRPDQRDWLKVKYQHTVDLIVVGVVGPVDRPTGVVLADPSQQSDHKPAATSQPLSGPLSIEIGGLVVPTGEATRSSGAGFFGRVSLVYAPVEPTVMVEVATDGVHEHGRLRHAVRIVRVRHEVG